MHDITMPYFLLVMVSCFLLSACSSVELVCITGLCPSVKERMAQIPWDPPALSHQNCPNISGKYQSRIYRGIGHLDLMDEFPQSNDDLGFINVTLKTFGEIPTREIPIPTPKNLKKVRYDDSEFYDNAFVLIQQDDKELAVSLIHNNGKPYRQQITSLHSSMIGCADGYLIIRTISPPRVNEGGMVPVRATEKRYRIVDGDLQITGHKREWNYDMVLGLRGMGPTGRVNDTGMPKESRYALIFKSVK